MRLLHVLNITRGSLPKFVLKWPWWEVSVHYVVRWQLEVRLGTGTPLGAKPSPGMAVRPNGRIPHTDVSLEGEGAVSGYAECCHVGCSSTKV
jgi:hypothetical protein